MLADRADRKRVARVGVRPGPRAARENPWFALKKRRPEAYDELVVHE
jgi:hypothetical protein